jgi:geranylgeranyl diphosphate synthase type II
VVDASHVPADDAPWTAASPAVPAGKRLRPRLLVGTYDVLAPTGSDPEPRDVAVAVGEAVELLHTAFLAHDDVIDDDQVRRGRPNVAGRYAAHAGAHGLPGSAARGYGAAAGLLAGDLALVEAVRTVAVSGARPAVVGRLLDLLDEAVRLSADGELRDLWFSHLPPTVDDVVVTARHKTAAYSFELPLRLAGRLAGRDDLDGALTRLGRDLGVAYQLRDDVLGTFGDPVRTGKPAGSDLREGRGTALVAFARTTVDWPRISPWLGRRDATEDDLAPVRALLERCGARAATEDLAARHEQMAAEQAQRLGLDDLVDDLLALAVLPAARTEGTWAA